MPYVLKALGKSVYRSMNSRFATGYDFRRRGGEGETGFLRMEGEMQRRGKRDISIDSSFCHV